MYLSKDIWLFHYQFTTVLSGRNIKSKIQNSYKNVFMRKVVNALLLAVFVAADIIVSKWIGEQVYAWIPLQATAEAKQVDALFSFLTAVGAFIFIGIVGTIAYSIVTCRVPKGDWSDGHPARSDWRIEALWTVVPLVFVLWIAAQSYTIYESLNIQGLTPIVHLHLPMEEPADAATKPTENNPTKPVTEEIEVIAQQWAWIFRYPRGNVTSTELHLPVNQSTRLVLQSKDVLHGFYVPEFRVQQDLIPNRQITFAVTPLREGKYRLQDSSYSGTYVALMEADVYVDSPEAYNRWLLEAASRPPVTASNAAFSEYTQHPKRGSVSGWLPVPPAPPPVVNYPS